MQILIKISLVLACISPSDTLRADWGIIEQLLFSDKSYAEYVEVKVYILTEKQSADLLVNPTQEPVQLLSSELAGFPKKYLAIRVKNLGNKNAWGTLACSVPRIWGPIEVPVINIQRNFCNYLISLDGFAVAEGHEKFTPKINFEWSQLYTK